MGKKESKQKKLTKKQELFCQYYVSQECFGNGTAAYLSAYGLDRNDARDYKNARSSAADNLTKPGIYNRINELLEEAGLNDQFVDKQLLFLIAQHADLASKRGAIQEYNKLRQRITDRQEVTHKGGLSINLGDDPDPDYIKWRESKKKSKKDA